MYNYVKSVRAGLADFAGKVQSLPVYTPVPEAGPGDALSPPHCRSSGCSRSHSRCSLRSPTTTRKRRRKRRSDRRPGMQVGGTPGARLASWQSGIQRHPETENICNIQLWTQAI